MSSKQILINQNSEAHKPKIRGLFLRRYNEVIFDFQRSDCTRERNEHAQVCKGASKFSQFDHAKFGEASHKITNIDQPTIRGLSTEKPWFVSETR